MAKVTHLFDNGPMEQDEVVKNLETIIDEIKAGRVIRYVIAIEKADGTIETGWTNAGLTQKQNLVSHLQIDIIYDVVLDNLRNEE